MSYTVTNLTANTVSAGKLTIPANGSATVDVIDAAIVRAVNESYLAITGITGSEIAGTLTELTDNSGGTASGTIAVIADSATANAVASLAALANQLAIQMNNANAAIAALDLRVNQ